MFRAAHGLLFGSQGGTPEQRPNHRSRLQGAAPSLCALALCALLGLPGCDEGSELPVVVDEPDEATPSTARRDAGSGVKQSAFVDAGRDAESTPALDATAEASALLDARLDDPYVDAARPALCARAGDDAVRDLFCKGPPRSLTSLRELQEALAINPFPAAFTEEQSAAVEPNSFIDGVVYMGHSTALAGHLVSPINPRLILIGTETFMAFQRGVQQVEIVGFDRQRFGFNFYLLSFTQACNARPTGCVPGDLFTPRIEADWTAFELRDDEELKNTPADCRQCHQRGREEPILLMRELIGPWTHFFEPTSAVMQPPTLGAAGRELVEDFIAAKGVETYAGVPAVVARHTAGLTLQNAVDPQQPLDFDSALIAEERRTFYYEGPLLRSATWDRAYEAFKRGEQLALPHFDARPTDPAKQAKLTEAYRRVRTGELPLEQLPDLADIFPDDPRVRAETGLQTEPGATPRELLVQACASCHNDVLDQSISRARFNVALARMSRAERELAIARISLPRSGEGVMPPADARQLDAQGRAALIAYLRADTRPAEDDAFLARAAELGMMGGGRP